MVESPIKILFLWLRNEAGFPSLWILYYSGPNTWQKQVLSGQEDLF